MTKFPENYYATVESITEEFEGEEFPAFFQDKDHLECDFCSVGVPYAKEPRVGHYMADRVVIETTEQDRLINKERILTSLATYCEDCHWRNIYFPTEGYTEVRAEFTITEDRIMRDFEITDISESDDGIPWEPRELLEKITQESSITFQQLAEAQQGELATGPENIVTFLFSLGDIDIRSIVNWDGSINGKELGQARRKYEKLIQKTSQAGSRSEHRKEFRDHVRENFHDN